MTSRETPTASAMASGWRPDDGDRAMQIIMARCGDVPTDADLAAFFSQAGPGLN